MGIWDFIGSAAETLKQHAPDAAPVKNACNMSYDYGSAAFTKIDQTVRVNGQSRLDQLMPDDETRSKIGMYTKIFAKNAGSHALQEGYKLIPGGVAVSEILSKTLDDVKHENSKVDQLRGGRESIAGANSHSGVSVKSVSEDGVFEKVWLYV